MLYQPLTSMFVDLYCYGYFALFRYFASDAGDVYRERLDPGTVEAVDAGAQELFAKGEQANDLRTAWREGMKELFKILIRRRATEERRVFFVWLVREMNSPRFLAEVRKIKHSPELLAFRIVRNRPVPAEADTIIQQALLDQVGNGTPAETLHDERERDALSALTGKILRITAALHDMETGGGGFPWRTTRAMWSEADKRAGEKTRWQDERKAEEREKNWGDMARVAVRLWDEGRDDTDHVMTHHDLRRRYEEVTGEIWRTFRAQRAKHYYRLWRLYYESGGDLLQNEATARQAEVSLRTVKTFFADAHKRGWIKD